MADSSAIDTSEVNSEPVKENVYRRLCICHEWGNASRRRLFCTVSLFRVFVKHTQFKYLAVPELCTGFSAWLEGKEGSARETKKRASERRGFLHGHFFYFRLLKKHSVSLAKIALAVAAFATDKEEEEKKDVRFGKPEGIWLPSSL